MTEQLPLIFITTGEPAGIGPELSARLIADGLDEAKARLVLVGDIRLLEERAKMTGLNIRFIPFDINNTYQKGVAEVWHTPLYEKSIPGQLSVPNAQYVLDTLDIAINACMLKQAAAMVTAPIHKGVINDNGIPFSGHTEYLAEKAGVPLVVMMLVGGGLRVALVTTHLPLKNVSDVLTKERIVDVIKILHADLVRRFGIKNPHILVTGLNPHAGEQGHLGYEDDDVIVPAIAEANALGIQCEGPVPADTAFLPARLKNVDVVLTMYHDQGLPVLKYASFGGGSNITLGLPFIRTSVDHGTALDLAGTGKADAGSLKTAIMHAVEMSEATRQCDTAS